MDTLDNGGCFLKRAGARRAQLIGKTSVPYGDRCGNDKFFSLRVSACGL